MGFLDGVSSFFEENPITGSLVKVAGLAFIASQMNKNVSKANEVQPSSTVVANIDEGVRLQIPPASNNKIPVLYGSAFFGGIITDAQMTNSNKRMTYCLTLSEKTGTKLSNGQASSYTFKDIYWDDQRIIFNADGITANYTVDRNGVVDRSINGLVKIWCYAGNSSSQTIPENYTNGTLVNAATVMPNWSAGTHLMSDLIFAIVEVNYNRDKNVTGIADMKFEIANSMFLPGDCLYDYMTNNRYGAGITSSEVNA